MLCPGTSQADALFESDDVLDVTLTGPLSTLIGNVPAREEFPFVFEAGDVREAIAVRTRGNSRLDVCEFPPLRLDFDHGETRGTVFDGQDKLKLVTHCRNNDRAEQDMLEEYLAYRLFNALTDASMRVRLLRIRYVDTDGRLDRDASPRYGFVLEPLDRLAARLGGVPAEIGGLPKRRHELGVAALVYVFQYMIGNTDWGFVTADNDDSCCHNVALVYVNDMIHTIPYDFDLSGLVNARYARPDPSLRIRNVRQRLYRGLCTAPDKVNAAIAAIRGKREALMAMPAGIAGLNAANVRKAERYLADFFELADDNDTLARRFERSCL